MSQQENKFARWTFRIAGIYGLLVLLPQYFLEGWNGRVLAINHPEYYYGFIGIAVAWQVVFLLISRDPARYRPLMLAAVIEKYSYGIATVILYLQGRIATEVLATGVVDMVLGALFLAAWMKTRS